MNNKDKFQEMLSDILEVAKIQGNKLSIQEIKNLFRGMDLNDQQFEQIFAYLSAYQIKIEGYVGTVSEYTQAVQNKTAKDSGIEAKLEEDPEDEQKTEQETEQKDEDSIYLKMYLEDLEAIEDCSDEENLALMEQIVRDDNYAKNRFIEGNLRYVIEVANGYRNQGSTLEDLIQEGNIGLMNSLDHLSDLTDIKNWKPFVTNYIKDSINAAVTEQKDNCNFENRIVEKIKFINDAANELAEDLGRKANIHELAACTKLSEKEIGDILNMSSDAIELGKHVDKGTEHNCGHHHHGDDHYHN